MQERFAIIRWDDDREFEIPFADSFVNTPHRASMLLEDSVYSDLQELDAALHKSFMICMNLHVPIQEHFQKLHVHNVAGHVDEDWALSDLAFYLLLLNGDVHKSAVAEAQAFAIRHIIQHH